MFDFISQIKGLFKTKKLSTDGRIFRLHYRATTLALGICCILVSSRQYFGEPIACMTSHKDALPENVINSFCWVQATYNSPSLFDKKVGTEVAHAGVGLSRDEQDVRYYKYYQWVGFVLFFQALMFYVPRYLWKTFERGTVRSALMGLNEISTDNGKISENADNVATYMHNSARTHNCYALKYFICEILAFANVVGQMYFINRFLDGEFTRYGPEVLQFMETDEEDRLDPMVRIFPRVTKCMFHKYGPTGELEKHAALCVLPLNIINEKVFVFMWFWFVLLATASGVLLLHRMLSFLPAFRVYTIYANNLIVDRNDIWRVVKNTCIGDWLLLYLLGKNMDSRVFKSVVQKLGDKLEDSPRLKKHSIVGV